MAKQLGSLGINAAGFVEIAETGKIHCFGRSESLDIETRGEEDEIIISKQLSKAGA